MTDHKQIASRIAILLGTEWSVFIEKNESADFFSIVAPGNQKICIDFFCNIVNTVMPVFGKDFSEAFKVIECDLESTPETIAEDIKIRLLPGYLAALDIHERFYKAHLTFIN